MSCYKCVRYLEKIRDGEIIEIGCHKHRNIDPRKGAMCKDMILRFDWEVR